MIYVNDVFSGIGGMALGLERTRGFRITSFCELDANRARVLKKHWPSVPVFGDIHELKAKDQPPSTWLIGGPPCNRTSIAAAIHGNWTGETLWPQMHRLLKEREYRGVIVEQPAKHKKWIETVHRHLERLGYSVHDFLIEAAEVGALHTRERIFFVAHRYGKRLALPRETRSPAFAEASRSSAARGHWDKVEPRVLRMDDGVSARMDGSRKWRIRAAGSSCVPHVAEAIGRVILKGMR